VAERQDVVPGASASHAYVVTCSEPDATPFLRALPVDVQERAVLVATGDVVRAAQQHTGIPVTFVVGGPSTAGQARRLVESAADVTVVVGPDPWGPVHGKGFVRARMMAPLIVPGATVDVVELRAGGRTGRVRRGFGSAAFSRWIRRREGVLFAAYLLRRALGSREEGKGPLSDALRVARVVLVPPRIAVTLAVVLPYVASTEYRARRTGPGA
jgi:hypothetical protein